MTSITLDTKVAQSQGVLASSVDNEIVMANINTDKYYGLNSVGTQIWQLLDRPKCLAEICDVLVERYDVERETCQSEVGVLVEKLVDAQILEVV